MLLSEQAEYLLAIPAKVWGDYATARANLVALIARARREPDPDTIRYLLQVLGDVEAADGNAAAGHALHREAIALNPHSPMPRLLYAKGLLRDFHLPAEAAAQLSESEALFRSRQDWDMDDPIEWYEDEFRTLREQLHAASR